MALVATSVDLVGQLSMEAYFAIGDIVTRGTLICDRFEKLLCYLIFMGHTIVDGKMEKTYRIYSCISRSQFYKAKY